MALSRPVLIGLGLTVALLGAIGFVPLFGGPGYESSLAAGILLPSIVAIVTALEVAALRPDPLEAVVRGLSNGAILAGAGFLTILAHGARVGFCDLSAGSAHFALGPLAGAILAGAWGACAGEIAGRRTTRRGRRIVAVIAGLLGPVASIGVSVYRFYTSPMIFAYDPFVGFFSGTLYDTVIDYTGLLSYRAGTAATLLAALALSALLERTEAGTLRLSRRRRTGLSVVFAASLFASLAVTASGPKLGHWHTSATIARGLGASFESARCSVFFPSGQDPAEIQRFSRDCDAHIDAAEAWFGAPVPFRITVFLFADAAQKASYMGAADTYIAKPWRREIYIQAGAYPHPVLGHELVHVIAGHFGRGPFAVAGVLGGIVPDPGLIEGVAVAASPRDGDLTAAEWAKAMKDLGLLPRLRSLFALSFLGHNSSVAYTVSGAFVGYIRERFGAEAIRAWYGGRDLPSITAASWEELERAWHVELDRAELSDAARAQAKARFDRPAIFGRRCPHVVDACKERAEEHRGRGAFDQAIAEYKAALELDPGDASLKVAIARAALRAGRAEEARGMLRSIAASEEAPRHVRDRAVEELGDAALAAGDGASAETSYREVMERLVDEDALRTLEVKIAAAKDPRARPAIVELLIGTSGRSPDKVRAIELLTAWAAEAPGDGLPHYLIGRHYIGAARYAEASERLDRAIAGSIATPRVRVEAERLRVVAACALGDAEGARRGVRALAAEPGLSASRLSAVKGLLERCSGGGPKPAKDGMGEIDP
ncbi:MAG TPA: tetratricopeptide repeat protein [Polyangiaceae bacterium]|nr:tetratricopeptide repeat protein [Polyangiaceae bacterium]